MARYKPFKNRDYRPSLKLNLRKHVEGGPLHVTGNLVPKSNPPSKRVCLVLVHGFNNHVGEASQAYYSFRIKQDLLHKNQIKNDLESRLADTFWPGDAKWLTGLDSLDFLFYPRAVHVAKNAAPLLAKLISIIPGLLTVHFIGHSLGCRLILETIKILQEKDSLNIGNVCLMAPAIENEMVSPGGKFESVLLKLHTNKSKILILHSTSDLVLGGSFPVGQKLAGEGNFPCALGLKPTPDMIGLVEKIKISGASHSDYWGTKDNEQSLLSAYSVGTFFNFGIIQRIVGSREIEIKRNVATSRKIN